MAAHLPPTGRLIASEPSDGPSTALDEKRLVGVLAFEDDLVVIKVRVRLLAIEHPGWIRLKDSGSGLHLTFVEDQRGLVTAAHVVDRPEVAFQGRPTHPAVLAFGTYLAFGLG